MAAVDALLFTSLALWIGVTGAPPAVTPPPADLVRRLALDPLYEKHVDAGGLPVLGSRRVSEFALKEAAHLIETLLEARPDVLRAMSEGPTRFVVMAHDEFTTDVPEHSHLRPRDYWDRRARGLGATPEHPAVSCGEENLLGFPGDPYTTENILIHEFAHAIHQMGLDRLDPSFDRELKRLYESAMQRGLWEGKYAATNRFEYWAEAVQSWFDTNRENDADHNHVDTRDELRLYDPALAKLVESVFGDGTWRYVKPSERATCPHLDGYEFESAPPFAWPTRPTEASQAERERHEALKRRPGESEVEHIRRLAESGDANAQVSLGWRYREGESVPADDALAVAWYRKAAAQGDAGGQDSLGWMYKTGRGVTTDPAEAVRWFRLAAEQDWPQGAFNLGLMLRDGAGMPRADLVEAYVWLSRAARGGHDAARRERERLAGELAPDELVEGNRRAAQNQR